MPERGEEAHDDSVLASPVRRRIVAHLAGPATASGPGTAGSSAGELAGVLGLHVTTVRFHLDRLIEAGLVSTAMEHREGVGRPRKLYSATPEASRTARPAPGALGSFEALAGLLADAWQRDEDGAPRTPTEAGAAWAREHARAALARLQHGTPHRSRSPGQWLGKVGLMLDLLREWGYSSRISTDRDGARIDVELSDCPFFGLARTHQEVVCGIHRGLLRGTLEVLGEPQVCVQLQPFVTETTCHAQLQPPEPFTDSVVEES